MNIGVLKLGGRLTWCSADKTGGVGEAKAICELMARDMEHNVHVYTKILDRERSYVNPPGIFVVDIMDFNEITDDVLVVFNGNVNFFGGAEDREQIRNYLLMNTFKGKIFYIYIDPELYLKQIDRSIKSKEWCGKYCSSDLHVTGANIEVITSMYNLRNAEIKFHKGKTKVDKFHYFPFQQYPLLNNCPMRPHTNPEYDLLYMGTYRGGKRQDKMIRYYFGHKDLKTTFIGKTKLKDFKKTYPEPVPEFLSPVPFSDIRYEINKAIAHVCIGDKFYEGNIFTPRIYECMLFGTVCLIDIDMDPKKTLFHDPDLNDFLYVSSKEEVREKVQILKQDYGYRYRLVQKQFKELDRFDKFQYYGDFIKILRGENG